MALYVLKKAQQGLCRKASAGKPLPYFTANACNLYEAGGPSPGQPTSFQIFRLLLSVGLQTACRVSGVIGNWLLNAPRDEPTFIYPLLYPTACERCVRAPLHRRTARDPLALAPVEPYPKDTPPSSQTAPRQCLIVSPKRRDAEPRKRLALLPANNAKNRL